jgi:hypothetical protein
MSRLLPSVEKYYKEIELFFVLELLEELFYWGSESAQQIDH